MAQDNREKYAYLDQLSTRRLEELLLADAEDTSGRDTSEVIFHILEVLRTREDAPAVEPVDVNRAWEEFQQLYNTPEGKGRSLYPCVEDGLSHLEKAAPAPVKSKVCISVLWKTFRIAAAAVALTLALMMGVQASGLNVFGTLAQWTDNILHFGLGKPSDNYDLFLEELGKNGIPKELAPSWYPTDFVASEPLIETNDSSVFAKISFTNTEGESFCIGIDRYGSPKEIEQIAFEKDHTSAEPYLSHGKTFYIFSNTDFTTATWVNEALSESIWGNLSVEDVKAMIDSIGGS